MKSYEAVAKTADEAIEEILSKMGVGIDELDLNIEEASKGFFGLFKQKQVKVTATLKNAKEIKEVKNSSNENSEKNDLNNEKIQKASKSKEVEKKAGFEESKAIPELINNPQEVIQEFIGLVADGMQTEIKVEVKEEKNTIKIDISGEEVSLLIGKHGRTLDSLRSLLSLMLNRGRAKEDVKRVLLDVEGYRKKRDNTLERVARSTATKVIKTKSEVAMEPMNPYERRIVHSVLQRNKLVSTRSEGDEPYRHVVVFLK